MRLTLDPRREKGLDLSTDAATDSPIVTATDLERVFGEGDAAVRAIDGVSIDFPRGKFTAIMGPSGSGKSTLMHCLAGLDRPTEGAVVIDGTELGPLDDAALTQLRRDKIGFVFQFFNLLPVLNAEENMKLPLTLAGRKPDTERFKRLVDAVGLADRLDHRPSELSGGQQQRVAIARALLSDPAVVFADEPTGNLDSRSSEEILALMRRTVDEFGQTVVMVTHDPVAAATADRVVVLVDGKIVRDEDATSPEQVLDLMKQVAA
jgi:putative ABC transport system ATP-binding protein